MPPARVVPALNPRKDCQSGFSPDFPAPPGKELAFQDGKETLGHGVDIGVSDCSQGGVHTHLLAMVAKGDAGALAALEWVSWFNHHRLLEPIGYIPPAEAEANYYRQLAEKTQTPVSL